MYIQSKSPCMKALELKWDSDKTATVEVLLQAGADKEAKNKVCHSYGKKKLYLLYNFGYENCWLSFIDCFVSCPLMLMHVCLLCPLRMAKQYWIWREKNAIQM